MSTATPKAPSAESTKQQSGITGCVALRVAPGSNRGVMAMPPTIPKGQAVSAATHARVVAVIAGRLDWPKVSHDLLRKSRP